MTIKRMNKLNKVLNKPTGRYVLKTGKIGRLIMKERKERREQKKADKIARLIDQRLEQIEPRPTITRPTINRRQMLKDIENFQYIQQVADEQNQMIESDQLFETNQQINEMKAVAEIKAIRTQLYNGDIQAGFDLFVMRKTTDKDDRKIIQLLDSYAVANKILIRFTLTDGSTLDRSLTKDNRAELIEVLKDGFISATARTHSSDEIARIVAMGIARLELITVSKESLFKKKGISKDGDYFKYINDSNIDLTRYQIIRPTDNQDIINENCLMYALKVLNIDDAMIQSVKSRIVKGAYVSKSNLYIIGDIIKKNINLHQYQHTEKDGETEKQYIQKFETDKKYDTIDLCLYDDHFFIYENMNITEYAIKHYSELKDIVNYHSIIKTSTIKEKKYYKRNIKKCNVDNLTVIKNLGVQGFFKQHIILSQTDQSTMTDTPISLDNIENEQREYEYKKKETADKVVFFADTETDTTHEHTPLLIGVIQKFDDNYLSNVRIFKRYDEERTPSEKYTGLQLMMFQFLNHMIKQANKKDIVVYFHNLKFDFYVLLSSLYIQDICEKAGAIYNVQFRYKDHLIEFRDSYKMATMPLCDFQKSFDLNKDLDKKEYIAYKYYKVKNQHKKIVKLSEYVKYLKVKDIAPFYELIQSSDRFKYDKIHKTFDPWEYYEYYLRYDCLVLCEGMKVFDKSILTLTDNKMSVFDSLTISSLTNKYMGLMGAFNGVYEVCGALRDYVSRAVTGGRVMVNERFKKKVIEGKIADYDGVSLYPASIYRLCAEYGLPIGKAKKLIDHTLLSTYDYYIVNVRITSINKKQNMPFISYKNKEGILNYIDQLPECGYIDVCVDRYTLEDYKEFHKIEYQIIDGVYWNEGYNKVMGEVIEKLFNERLRYKSINNEAMQLILKLMMNSAYGKTIISKSTTRTVIKSHTNKKIYDDYVCKNFYSIKEIKTLNERQSIITHTQFDKSYNMAHVGTMILSISKRIMNEVFDVANTHGLNIYYTDTDSIHMDYDAVPILEKEFMNKYDRQLTGKNMGQFHIDFSMKHNGKKVKTEIYSTKLLCLGKKTYIDLLESIDEKGEKIQGVHYRIKGMTTEGIEHGAEKFGGDIFKLYEHMADNVTTLLLNPKDKFMIKYEGKRAITRTEGDFSRTMDFTGKKP